jgi:hypothetical protein
MWNRPDAAGALVVHATKLRSGDQRNRRFRMKNVRAVAAAMVLGVAAQAAAASAVPVSIPDRVRGSEQVVVATVSDLRASYETNEFGDKLIVSHVRLQVHERLKGEPANAVDVDVEGGTVGDVTMDVSSLPPVSRGDRAVFFLERNQHTGRLVPHLQGLGILMLDSNDRVKGALLDLNTIRALAASANGR